MEGGTRVKEEVLEEFELMPMTMEELHMLGPPPFLTKIYEMVENSETDEVVSWSEGRNSFIVWDYVKFSSSLLPKYFKHNNFSSFIRQLNTYGFRKVDPDRYEFANEGFLGGQKHLLRTIKGRRHVGQQRVAGATRLEGFDDELGMLKRQRKILLTEVLGLKQRQLDVKDHMIEMQERLLTTERKQQRWLVFFLRAVSNPLILEQFLEGCEKRGVLVYGDENRKKQRITGGCSSENSQDGSFGKRHQVEELLNMESEIESLFSCGMENDANLEKRFSKMDAILEEDAGDNKWDYVNEAMWEDLDLPSEELIDWDIEDQGDDVHSGDQADMKVPEKDLVSPIAFGSGDEVQDLFDQMNYLNRNHTPVYDGQ